MNRTRTTAIAAAAATLVVAWPSNARADLTWFDPTAAGPGYASFAELAAAYGAFVADAPETISFNGWAQATLVDEEYGPSDGVWFDNVGSAGLPSGVWRDGSGVAEDITGYDGTFRPDGDNVLVKFANNNAATPFTIRFDQPASVVGAFIGMGVQGAIHSLTIRAFDAGGTLLGSQVIESWLWEATTAGQNYEGFFALRSDQADVARVEILNNATTNYANALIFDELRYTAPDPGQASVPEPANLVLLGLGAATMLIFRPQNPRR